MIISFFAGWLACWFISMLWRNHQWWKSQAMRNGFPSVRAYKKHLTNE